MIPENGSERVLMLWSPWLTCPPRCYRSAGRDTEAVARVGEENGVASM